MSTRWIAREEVHRLEFELRGNNTPVGVKRALQDLCVHLENGRKLPDPTSVRVSIHSHMWGQNVPVRRWALKALALLNHPEDVHRIVALLKEEKDAKARSWGIAGLVRQAKDKGIEQVCREAGLQRDTALVLASRLYAPSSWLESQAKPEAISIDDDALVLEWATFLIGYDRAPPHLFNPRHENQVFLGELNGHDDDEIVEYSVWALCERPDLGFANLRMKIGDFDRKPPNVRKWLYRVISKDPYASGLTPDMIEQFSRDNDVSAREGLAIGLTGAMFGPAYDDAIVDWYAIERDEGVREMLVAGMAGRSAPSDAMKELISERFMAAPAGERLQRKLLAAAEGAPMYGILKRFEIEQAREAQDNVLKRQGLLEFDRPATIINLNNIAGNADFTMGNTIKARGDINAQNVVGGDMIASANAAVQSISTTKTNDREVLEAVIAFVTKHPLDAQSKELVLKTVEQAAKDPSPENKSGVLKALKSVGGAVATVGAAAGGYAELIDLVSGWLP